MLGCSILELMVLHHVRPKFIFRLIPDMEFPVSGKLCQMAYLFRFMAKNGPGKSGSTEKDIASISRPSTDFS